MTDARARVPGHLTLVFTVDRGASPGSTGSRGVGVALEEGVEVAVADGDGIEVNGRSRPIDPVDRVLDRLGVRAAVSVRTSLPLGAGFGVSGAAALGTALAAAASFDLAMAENELIAHAHAAEVEAGTGLGDVVAQARGGVPVRVEAGDPDHGRMDGIPAAGRVEYVTRGEVSTTEVLAGDVSAITAAGDRALGTVLEEPTLDRAFRAGRAFVEEAALADRETAAIVEAVLDAGGTASVGLLGRTVVAPGTDLSDAGYDPAVTAIDPAGARVVAGGPAADGGDGRDG